MSKIIKDGMVRIKKCALENYNNLHAIVHGDLCVIIDELNLDCLGTDHLDILRTRYIEDYEYICIANSHFVKAITTNLLK